MGVWWSSSQVYFGPDRYLTILEVLNIVQDYVDCDRETIFLAYGAQQLHDSERYLKGLISFWPMPTPGLQAWLVVIVAPCQMQRVK
jgi:hypothetical protein